MVSKSETFDSPKGLFNLFSQHIYPLFVSSCQSKDDFARVVSDFWAPDVEKVLTAKLYDNEECEKSLRRRFEDAVVGDEDQNSGHQEFARTMYHRCMWILRGSLKSSQKIAARR
ncbi:hypothetical protein N7530_004478 [Penicillium desertorum]|uniref:Uncharacterized protein n=1 Tax=Penicillium desertorum TaxID=1303715 RepID=A0A9X0BQE9_9EURO|nr:hypothetical protein N7530_004478 [Penicillium desertorum]